MGVGPDGKTIRREVNGASKNEVTRKVRALEAQRDAGLLAHTPKVLLADHIDAWIDRRQDNEEIRPTTAKGYRTDARYIRAALPGVKLGQVSPRHVDELWTWMLANDINVAHCRRTLRAALNDAVRRGLIPRNPVERAGRPKQASSKPQPYAVSQMRAFLTAARLERNAPRWTLASLQGLRQGEALGLQWDDLDLDDLAKPPVLHVRRQLHRIPFRHGCADPDACTYINSLGEVTPAKRGADCPKHRPGGLVTDEPKSENGHRLVVLPEPVRRDLLTHRDRQADEAATNPLWEPGPGGGWVFPSADGGPTDPRQDHRDFVRIMTAAALPHRRLHDLRHSSAEMMVVNLGIGTKTAGQVLGHASDNQTSAYLHALTDARVVAANKVGELFYGPETKPKRRKTPKGTGG
ncbi:MAG: tyrosine-type recombinase/integrase [Acidimicrobiales bacterium]